MEYKTGDILLFKTMHGFPGCLQAWFDGPAGHAEIIVDEDVAVDDKTLDRKIYVNTLGTNFDGMKYRTHLLGSDHCVLRATFPVDATRMIDAIQSTYDGHSHKYAYAGLLNAALQQALDDVTFHTWKKHVPLRVGDALFCSATVAECYLNYNGYKFQARGEVNMRPEVVTPNDCLYDPDFTIVKPFGV